ncbi:hypothetical protein AMJ39_02185 [candidate division TA06 bacterium DG_24]|uniref:SHSP domain-containing protein n=3 Tax=Bacteria division TA06 TaxID=1156500 RepID=A0A0S8JKX0_UNCT6|nr:MAG: hypothetical protein AMJ39_02185 [candidate division TA06 bacterium DG_24]KPK69455.1 MAG: hypothetical protein AMJ82_05515 [candidate division TA06 bacterium SM23_40]KPL10298.1 MAG: hypothetical protein AMJ71_03645 [candidate division TA06 bacterium SM1_40]
MERDDILDDVNRMRNEVEALFEDFFRFQHSLALAGGHVWRPSADCYETKAHIVIIMELAGVAAEDVEVFASARALTVRGTRRDLTPRERHRNYHKMEINFGDFEQVIPFWCSVDIDDLETSLDRGILTIRMPKEGSRPQPRTIDIE